MQKQVDRSQQSAEKIFDNRSLQSDFRTIIPAIKRGMKVLDVGCGTGAISRGIADLVGEKGIVVGIDNTTEFISSGQLSNASVLNLNLIHADIMSFETDVRFDLILSARTLQWLSNAELAIVKMKKLLVDGGILSVLDYVHEDIKWVPNIPQSMQEFYANWLRWREESGMNNRMAEDLPNIFQHVGFKNIEIRESNEFYSTKSSNFADKLRIWNKVASSTQLVKEGFISEALRLQAIEDYNYWVENQAESMLMVLKEVRGVSDH